MLNKTVLLIICISFLVVTAGCGDSDVVPEEEGISIEVANNTEEIVISYAAFFGEDLDEWGEDLLGDEIIAPGEAVTFVLPEGEYDLSLFNQDFFVIHSVFDIAEDTKVDVGGGGTTPLLVQNTSVHNVIYFFALPGGFINLDAIDTEEELLEEDWAETWDEIWEDESIFKYQLLHDREVVIAENGRRFFFIDPGTYDFLIVNEQVQPYLEMEVEIGEDDRKVLTID